MLSQRIAKGALAVRAGLDVEARLGVLNNDVAEWQAVHRGLLDGDAGRGLPGVHDPDLRVRLDSLTGTMKRVSEAVSALEAAVQREDAERADRSVQAVLNAEALFLLSMDRVVFALDDEASSSLLRVRRTTGLVLLTLLGSLAAVAGLVLRPAIQRVTASVEQLDRQGRLLRTVIDTIPDHIYVKDTEGRATLRNLASARALGFSDPEAAVGRTDADDSDELGQQALGDDLHVVATGEAVRNKTERDLEGGWLLTTKVPLHDVDGEIVGLVGVSRDVTAAKEAEAELRATAERLALLVRNLQAAVLLEDERGHVLIANLRFCTLFGLDAAPEALVGRPGTDVVAEAAGQAKDSAAFLDATEALRRDRRPASGGALALKDDRVLEWELVPVHLGEAHGGHLWLFRDVTERREWEDRLYHQAHHDALTGVPNRTLFTSRLSVAVARQREGHGYALLFADLDGFKAVNDTLGHSAGDDLLRTVASRLQRVVRPSDTVARLGGDEFAVLLDGMPDDGYAEAVAARVREAVAAPICIEGHEVEVGISVGVVAGRPDHCDPDAVLLEADRAMYRAKREGRVAPVSASRRVAA